jgi:tetratricopeptide (TPR) repeat protein
MRVTRSIFLLIVLLVTSTTVDLAGQSIRGLDRLSYGTRLYDMGLLPEAIATLRLLLADSPDTDQAAQAQFLIADAYLKQEQWAQAHEEFLRFVTKYHTAPNIEEGWQKLAESLEGQGQYAEAARMSYYGASLLSERGEIAMPLMLRAGRAYAVLGDTARASNVFRQVTLTYPHSGGAAEAMLELGDLALERKIFAEALRYYNRAEQTSSQPGHTGLAAYWQGITYQQMGEVLTSIDPLQRAVNVLPSGTPEGKEAALQLASSLNETEQWDAADKILDALGATSEATLERATGLRYKKDYDAAEEVYSQLLGEALPVVLHARTLLGLGQTQELLHKKPDAAATCQQAVDLLRSLDTPAPNQLLREALETTLRLLADSDPVTAADYLLELTALTPDTQVELAARAGRYFRQGAQYDRAILAFGQAESAADHHPLADDIALETARTYDAAERYNDAERAYRRMIELYSGSPLIDQAREALQFLETHRVIDPATQQVRLLDLSATIRAESADAPLEDLLRLAHYYVHDSKDFPTAVEKLTFILNREPSEAILQEAQALLATAYDRLSIAALHTGDTEAAAGFRGQAIALYTTQLENTPETPATAEFALRLADLTLQSTPDSPERAVQARTLYEDLLQRPEIREEALYRLGRQLVRNNMELPEALTRAGILHYQTLTEEYPAGSYAETALYQTARGFYKLQDLDATRTVLQQHRTLYPAARYTPEALDMLASLDLHDNQPHAAALRYNELTNHYWYTPLIAERHQTIGNAYLQSDRHAEALAAYREAIAQWLPTAAGDSAQSNVFLQTLIPKISVTFDSLQAPGGITDLLEELDQRLPDTISRQPIYFALGNSYRHVGEMALAIRNYMAAGEAPGPKQAEALEQAAACYLKTGVYAESQRLYEQLAEQTEDPEIKAAMESNVILNTYRQNRVSQADKAVDTFKKAYEKTPNWTNYRWLFELEKGKAYFSVKNYKKAQDILEDVAKQAGKVPAGAEGLYFLAVTYQARKDNRDTESLFEVVEQYPAHPIAGAAHKLLAAAYFDVGDNANAVTQYRAATNHHITGRTDTEAWKGLIDASHDAGFYEAHLAAIRRYLELFPYAEDRFDLQTSYGTSLIEMGQAASARAYFEELLSVVSNEEEAMVQFYLARAISAMGYQDLAAAEFLKVLYYGGDVPSEYIAFSLIQLAEINFLNGKVQVAIGYYKDLLEREGASSSLGLTAQTRIAELQKRLNGN